MTERVLITICIGFVAVCFVAGTVIALAATL